jgi:DNA polymerase V
MLLELQPDSVRQGELDWGEVGDQGGGGSLAQQEDKTRLMSALDSINQRFGKGTMKMASAGLEGDRRAWSMKQERRTPAYTTCWADIPVARA